MKFKNAVAVAALIGHTNSIRIHDKNENNLLSLQRPEEQQVSEQDIFTYSSLVSDGETMSKIKEEVAEMNKPKPLGEDLATGVFQEKIDQLTVQNIDPKTLASMNEDAEEPEVQPVTVNPQQGKSSESKLSQKEQLQQADSLMEENENTEAWAKAKVETPNAFVQDDSPHRVQDDFKSDNSKNQNMNYNDLFHAAAVDAYKGSKSFEEMQQADLEQMDDDQQSQALAQKIQKSMGLDTLDKEGSSSSEQNSDTMPDALQDTDMITAIAYAETASEDSNQFAEQQAPKKQEPRKIINALAQSTQPKEKSFYEQILDKTVADTGKGAIKVLAEPLKAPPKQQKKKEDVQNPDDRSLLEQLWEKQHPGEVRKLENEKQSKKDKLQKDVLKQQENGFASITSSINLLGLS